MKKALLFSLLDKTPIKEVLTKCEYNNVKELYDFLSFITNQAVHMVEIDISMASGLLEAKKIAELANTYYLPVATHNVMEPIATIASANCAATMLDFIGHESYDYKQDSRDGHAGWENLIGTIVVVGGSLPRLILFHVLTIL